MMRALFVRPERPCPQAGQRGQSTVEYLVAALVMLAIVAGTGGEGEPPVLQVLSALREAFERLSAFLSLPGG